MKNKITNFLLLLFCLSLNIGIATAQKNHEYVDLGLPSGTLWATCNIGAENPWECGDYFAWGETTTKADFSWENSNYAYGAEDKLTKYCYNPNYGNNGFTDTMTELERSDDAATANWGSDWSMPTIDQIKELTDKCTWTWTTDHGINGYKVAGTNGQSIFLPAAGCHLGTSLSSDGFLGSYWSSSLGTDCPNRGCYLFFYSGGVTSVNWGYRCCGFSVRPVLCRIPKKKS